ALPPRAASQSSSQATTCMCSPNALITPFTSIATSGWPPAGVLRTSANIHPCAHVTAICVRFVNPPICVDCAFYRSIYVFLGRFICFFPNILAYGHSFITPPSPAHFWDWHWVCSAFTSCFDAWCFSPQQSHKPRVSAWSLRFLLQEPAAPSR